MLLLGYILGTRHKNNIVTLHVTFMLYRRNKTCLLGRYNRFHYIPSIASPITIDTLSFDSICEEKKLIFFFVFLRFSTTYIMYKNYSAIKDVLDK